MKTRAIKKREAEDTITYPKRARNAPGCSPIELLPPELLNEVLDGAPEAVPHFHKASRAMKERIENYAKQDRMQIPLADQLELKLSTRKANTQGVVHVHIRVPQRTSKLFELRARLLHGSFTRLPPLPQIVQRAESWVGKPNEPVYTFVFETMERDGDTLDLMNKVLGGRISGSIILSCFKRILSPFPCAASALLLNGIRGSDLRVQFWILTDDLLNVLEVPFFRNLNEIKLIISRNHAISDPKSFLNHLSTRFQRVSIRHGNYYDLPHNLFGVSRNDWGELVLDMFSNKLDTLKIPNYLNLHGENLLRERLPLFNKKIYFEIKDVSTNRPQLSYTLNDYSVLCDNIRVFINHVSRTNERKH